MEIMMSWVNKKNENEWYFVEVYFDDKAYDAHIKSPQYVEYIENTDGMVARRDVKDLVRDTLATHGEIVLDEVREGMQRERYFFIGEKWVRQLYLLIEDCRWNLRRILCKDLNMR